MASIDVCQARRTEPSARAGASVAVLVLGFSAVAASGGALATLVAG